MPAVFTTSFCRRKKEKIPPRQSLHTPIAGKPMARAIGFPAIQSPQTPHVRGGSVSRRGLSQLTGIRTHSQAEPPMQKQPTQTPAALRERGVWGERRFSQRSGLSPQRPPPPRLFKREREGGGFSTEKPPPSQFFSLFLLVFNDDSAVEMGDFGGDHFPNVAGA